MPYFNTELLRASLIHIVCAVVFSEPSIHVEWRGSNKFVWCLHFSRCRCTNQGFRWFNSAIKLQRAYLKLCAGILIRLVTSLRRNERSEPTR